MSDHGALGPMIFDLLGVVERLAALHEEMAELIQAKLRAMRGSDVQKMRESSDHEHRVLREILNQQDRRHRIVDLAGRRMGMSSQRARGTSLKQWAQHCKDPLSTRVMEAGRRLGQAVSTVAQLNRMAGRAAEETIGHLNAILTPGSFDPSRVLYDGAGRCGGAGHEPLFSAIF